MKENDNRTIIDFGDDDNSYQDTNTVIEISDKSEQTYFAASSKENMCTILDMDDDFGLDLSNQYNYDNDQHMRFFSDISNEQINSYQYNDHDAESEEYVEESNHLTPKTIIAGRYEIIETIGVGGFSIVYRAYDKKLETEVAMKELYPPSIVYRKPGDERVIINGRHSEFDYLLDRFVLEARTMAKYNSDPNIVNVFDCVLENNTAYIIMEVIKGCNLEEYIASKPEKKLTLEEALPIMCSVLDGLERVHKKGIIHRDIKPKNIILTDSGEVKIIDFGAARLSSNEEEVINSFTKVLTPGFAPPEQYRKDSKQGPFTDVYAAATTFYYMLTGIVPEPSVDRVISDTLKPFSEVVENIPRYVDVAERRALVLNCDLRVQSASDFKMAILGKKNLRNAQDEKNFKIRNRLVLLISTILLFAVGISGFVFYQSNYAGGVSICRYIKSDEIIDIWLPVSASDEKSALQIEMYERAVNGYKEYASQESKYQINVNSKFISEDKYEETVLEAYKNGNMPDIFDSSRVNIPMDNIADCDRIFKFLSSENYALFDYYQKGLVPKNKFAMSFDTTIIYTNDKIMQELGIDELISPEDVFELPNYSEYLTLCQIDDACEISYKDNVYTAEDAAIQFKNNNAIAYVGKASEFPSIFDSLPGYCNIISITESNGKIPINLTTWSVYKNSENKVVASQAFLYYVTGEDMQDLFYLQNRGEFPTNQSVLSLYSKYYPQFSFVTDDNGNYVIK